ncbi:MAG: 2Fe-2S iron-sulfur cluster-binding protein [Steroidobacteraceae bacterium]
MSGFRLAAPAGRDIDRSRPLSFEFNGRSLSGFEGDTLASALLANGVRLIGRSFKLHRPRGIFSCGVEEPTGIVDVGAGRRRTPNQRATLVPLQPGLVAESVNCWPSVDFDLGAINGLFASFLPSGFYYKTFMWPNWHWFEPTVRRMAGLGRGSGQPDPDRYEEVSASADVLVVGAGATGIAAALAAAQAGATTVLLASGEQLGGIAAWAADEALDAQIGRLEGAGVRVLRRTMAFGAYDHNLVCAVERLPGPHAADGASPRLRERLWKIRARSIISACGAFERPLLFPDNDRPGIMLGHAVLAYARRYGVACGRRVLIAANSDSAFSLATALRQAGLQVAGIADVRPAELIGTRQGDMACWSQAHIVSVRGARSVSGCTVRSPEGDCQVDCDLIASAGGFAPAVHLHSQAGGRLRWLEESAMFVPDGHAPGLYSVGASAGVFAPAPACEHAAAVGRALARGETPPPAPVGGTGCSLADTRVPNVHGKQFVDLQNDVAHGDVGLAARENYRSVEHLKRYTTTGMGTDQGKTSNVNALVLMGTFTDRAPPQVGTTKFRPPFAPVSLGLLVGRRTGDLYRPRKRLPAWQWHVERGALWEDFGLWRRPVAYPRGDEDLETAAQREALHTRTHVGIFDGSPLGKIEIYGADAARFLDLMYVGTMSTLAVGQARYGLVPNENGVVVDDGIVARLSERHFWVNTTSSGAEQTAAAFEEWLQCEYPQFEVLITPVTSRWGNVTVAGPKAWRWLEACGFDAALSPSNMKHMTLRDSTLDDIPLRVLRASFSGELGYEINLPVESTSELFERLWSRAGEFDAAPYGIEALEILRVEKGFLHVGSDTDGTTLPQDVGFGGGIAKKTAECVGRRSLLRAASRDPARPTLVGLAPADGRSRLPVGGQISNTPPPTLTEGHVTSSFWSPNLRKPVALAMLSRGAHRLGETVRVHHLGATVEAVVVKPPFFDPEGKRLHG